MAIPVLWWTSPGTSRLSEHIIPQVYLEVFCSLVLWILVNLLLVDSLLLLAASHYLTYMVLGPVLFDVLDTKCLTDPTLRLVALFILAWMVWLSCECVCVVLTGGFGDCGVTSSCLLCQAHGWICLLWCISPPGASFLALHSDMYLLSLDKTNCGDEV